MAKELIKFLQIRNGIQPLRAHEFDAGIDFFVPEFNSDFIKPLIEKNAKAFQLQIEPEELKFHGNSFNVSSFSVMGSSNATYSEGQKERTQPQDFFGFDIEEGEPYFVLRPGHGVMIPSGFKCRMSKPGRALVAANKSGVATKHKLTYGAQVVDYTYKGEVHLHLINNSDEDVKIYQNQKIIQFLETPVFVSGVDVTKDIGNTEEIEKAFYKGLRDDRKDGGFGSTDQKKK